MCSGPIRYKYIIIQFAFVLYGKGIGRQLVQRFYDGGAIVCTLDKNPATVENLRKQLPNVKAEVVDLSDWDATRKVVESFGAIEYAINSAGVIITEEFLNIKKETAALYVKKHC